MSPEAQVILRSAVTHGWYVSADNLLRVAELLRAGLIECEDDYDTIAVRGTEKGLKSALRRRLVAWRTDAAGNRGLEWDRDPAALKEST